MNKKLKIILIVLLVIAIAVGALVIWQWGNIKAVFMTFKYSEEEINTLIVENDEKIERILDEITPHNLRALTEEEMAKLQSGELTREEALLLIKGLSLSDEERLALEEAIQNGTFKNANEPESESGVNQKSGKNVDEKSKVNTSGVDDIIAEIYLLRAEYVNALSGLEAEAVSSAKSIPNKELTISKRLDFIESYTGRAVALEGQCDARMNSLIALLDEELKKTGGNRAVISEIRSVYASEKELKKSQLLSKYGKYFK